MICVAFVREEEERFVFQPEVAAFAKFRQPHWTTDVAARIKVTIKRFLQAGFVVEERRRVERLVAEEVVDRTGEVFAAAFRNDVDDRAAVVAVFGAVVVAQHLHFGNGVLVDRHAQLV